MDEPQIQALDPSTWDAYAALVDRHHGVCGGCWCTWFHTLHAEKTFTAEGNHALKRQLVEEGRAHAALVVEDDRVVAWCQYGPPAELPNIYHRKQYDAERGALPDRRITCLFVDKAWRRRGLSGVALDGALGLIAAEGGGVVEAYPHDTHGKRVSNLYNGTRTLFERAGFTYVRPKGQQNCVMRKQVGASPR
jgi:GNAT superfamily N-acetyltransferase